IMSGKSLTVLHDIENDMQKCAEAENFEEAQQLKVSADRLRGLLQKHYDPNLYTQSDSFLEHIYEGEMGELKKALERYYPQIQTLGRIECIDISNTMGTHAVGSLVVFTDGRANTSLYRRF